MSARRVGGPPGAPIRVPDVTSSTLKRHERRIEIATDVNSRPSMVDAKELQFLLSLAS